MRGGGNFSTSDGMGGKAFSVVDAVVSFFAAFFHRVLATLVSPSKSKPKSQSQDQQQEQQSQQGSGHDPESRDSQLNNQSTERRLKQEHLDAGAAAPSHDDGVHRLALDADANPQRMPPPLQQQPAVPRPPAGPKVVGANANPINVTSQQVVSPGDATKQENVPTNGAAYQTVKDRGITNGTNGSKPLTVGDEQAEENRQEHITLPPPVLGQDADEQEDPAEAAERAIHHGFMNQALDMVRLLVAPPAISLMDFCLFFQACCLCGPVSLLLHRPLARAFTMALQSCCTRPRRFKPVHLIAPPPSDPHPSLHFVLPSLISDGPYHFRCILVAFRLVLVMLCVRLLHI